MNTIRMPHMNILSANERMRAMRVRADKNTFTFGVRTLPLKVKNTAHCWNGIHS